MRTIDDTAVLGLVDDIYAAGAAFDLWPRALERIADAFGAREAALGATAADGLAWLFAPRTDPDYLRTYAENYHALNDYWHRMTALGTGAVVTDEMVMPREALLKSAFHNEWSLPQGYQTKLGGTLFDEGGWRTVFALTGRTHFGSDALRLFRLLSPHMARAVRLNIRLARGEADSALSAGLLQEMATAALVVDAYGRLLYANPAAERLFKADRGLRLEGGVLAAERQEDAAHLRRLVTSCLGDGRAFAPPSAHLRGASGKALTLEATPLQRRMPVLTAGQPSAILFDVTEQAPDDLCRRLQTRYGLTAAEAAFALEIAKGDGKPAAAERRGITFATARTHLSRIFDKTGVHRQAELVRLILDETV